MGKIATSPVAHEWIKLYPTGAGKNLQRVAFGAGALAATLLIGRSNILQKRRNPIFSDLRRDIGVWARILCVMHSLVGQNVHLRRRPWLYYLYEHRERHVIPLRHDLFGFANYTGLWSLLVLIALLATSND
jgi:sulfoxide reductase heme-binding subunit YedZ